MSWACYRSASSLTDGEPTWVTTSSPHGIGRAGSHAPRPNARLVNASDSPAPTVGKYSRPISPR